MAKFCGRPLWMAPKVFTFFSGTRPEKPFCICKNAMHKISGRGTKFRIFACILTFFVPKRVSKHLQS